MRIPVEHPWIRPFLQPVTFLGLGVSVLVFALLPYLVAKDRTDAYEAAVRDGRNLTRLLEGYLTRTINSADQNLLFLRKLYQQDSSNFQLATAAKSPGIRNELTFQFTIANADGIVTDSSYSKEVIGAYRGDQEGFRAHLQSSADELFISRPLRLVSSGRWAIVLSRRITAADGSFAGVIVATLDPQQLQIFSNTLELGAESVVSVLGFDGTIFATAGPNGPNENMLGRSIPTAGVFGFYREAPVGNYWVDMQLRDSVRRLISYRVIEGLPLIAIVGISENQIFKHAAERAWNYYAISAVILALTLAVIFWGNYRERMLRQANMLLEQVLAHMPHGVCMFGADKQIKISNSLYATMYGLTVDQTKPGTTLREILEARIAVGCSPKETDKYIMDRLDEAFRPEPGYIVNELRDGRIFGINRRSMPDGGSVAIHQDITEQRRAQEKIEHLAHYDGLTNLANRTLFLQHVEGALRSLAHSEDHFAVYLLDLDRFKEVNDSLGHAVGDALLKQVAHRLVTTVERHDVVARLGGDEFAVLQRIAGEDVSCVGVLAEKLLKSIAKPFEVGGHQLAIETSIGIALIPNHATESDDLLKKADLALYRAKSDGRNGWRIFETEMEQEARSRLALAMDLRRGIACEEFELHYQPVVSTENERPAGAEALVRWRNAQRGLVPPGDFIPLAEDAGLIVPLGEWVLRRACRDAANWPEELRIAVNLSPVQFKAGNLLEVVKGALSESGLAAQRLELEVTETVLLQHNEENLRILHQLRELGISIVLDDFGTGYSSMSYLLSFPFDKIKIDRKFVSDLQRSDECAAIVSAVARLAENLDIAVTAEGVETVEQFKLVRIAGCGLAQGYLFGRPTPAAQFHSFLAEETQRSASRRKYAG